MLGTAEHTTFVAGLGDGLQKPSTAPQQKVPLVWHKPWPEAQLEATRPGLRAQMVVLLGVATLGKFSSQKPLQLLSRPSHFVSMVVRLPLPSTSTPGTAM
jgi:hypothetical protein